MGLKIPRHRVDAPPCFVSESDDAWDRERIELERAAMARAGRDPDDHPVSLYHAGNSRYDLGAKHQIDDEQTRSASEYLRPGAWMFHLRRLSHDEYYRAKHRAQIDGIEVAMDALCPLVLERMECPGGPAMSGKQLTADEHAELFRIDHALPVNIGWAAWRASAELRDDEKKL